MKSASLSPQALLTQSRPAARRGTYFVHTWGCQMNEEDSEQIRLHLEALGFEASESLLEAQVVILNTCSVRRKPEDKAFSLLGELVGWKQSQPDRVLGVCGCMAQLRSDEIRRRAPHVDFVLGTGDISLAGSLVEEALQTRRFAKRIQLPERKGAVVSQVPTRTTARAPKLKAFVPIQYGCDKFCTFCIVPTTRGRERSRPTEEIVQEVSELAARGTKEVTLLGQTVNSYGKNLLEGRVTFAALLRRLAETPGLERIRCTSPYPRDYTADLIETIRDVPQVMEQVHLPLQSGDSDVLKAMRRLYTHESFLQIAADLRAACPNVGLTTDIIVGFPGETEEQFERTLEVVREVQFDGAFMFIYSPRPGTPAADMEQHPLHVRKSRMDRLAELQNGISAERNRAREGRVFEVLVEGRSHKDSGQLQGFTREGFMMHFAGTSDLFGQLVQVRATRGRLWGMEGELA